MQDVLKFWNVSIKLMLNNLIVATDFQTNIIHDYLYKNIILVTLLKLLERRYIVIACDVLDRFAIKLS